MLLSRVAVAVISRGFGLFAGNVYVLGGNHVGSVCNLLYLTVDCENYAAKEVDNSLGGFLVGLFEIENDGASCEKMLADNLYFVEALGLNDLHFQSRAGGDAAGCSCCGSGGSLGLLSGSGSYLFLFLFFVAFIAFVFVEILGALERLADVLDESPCCAS